MDHEPAQKRQQGQVMVLFLLAIFAIIGMVGLVLDGGSVFAQRRDQQTAADLAAMAGAAAYLNATGTADQRQTYAEGVANSVATANGYVEGTLGVNLDFAMNTGTFFTDVTIELDKPHRNNFAAILGMPTWQVGVTATARATYQANGARGAMPLHVQRRGIPGGDLQRRGPDLHADGLPAARPWERVRAAGRHVVQLDRPVHGQRKPVQRELERRSSDLIHGQGANTVIYLDDNIDPLNAGTHTTLFNDLEGKVGIMFPVPIVTDDGHAVGWAYFKLTSIEGAPDKVISGYFVSPVNGEELVVNGGHTNGTLFTGAYSVRLTN